MKQTKVKRNKINESSSRWTVRKVRAVLEEFLEKLEGLEEDTEVRLRSNTYMIHEGGNVFLGFVGLDGGYLAINDLDNVEEEDEWEGYDEDEDYTQDEMDGEEDLEESTKKLTEAQDLYDRVAREYGSMTKEELRSIAVESLFQLYDRLSPEDYQDALRLIEYYTYGEPMDEEEYANLVDDDEEPDINEDDYAEIDPNEELEWSQFELDESKQALKEGKWNHKEPRGEELRDLISADFVDHSAILKLIYNIASKWAEELGENDEYGLFAELAEVVKDEWEIVDDEEMLQEFGWGSADDLVDERLEQLYDAADESRIWIGR